MSGRAVVVGCLWAAAVAGGFAALHAYQLAPGRADLAPSSQPAAGRPSVLVFLHPHCPCTPAAVRNLGPVLERHPVRVTVYVLDADPRGSENGRLAAALPGADVIADPDGSAARRFGAKTSGHVLVYDAGGALVFAGGVTAGRGHPGANPGLDAVAAHLAGRPGAASAPVFGCPLTDD